ncbi:DNA integrity scanning protein DisA nucleotide-binding domain protein [Dyadobacter sp. CY345]|uniref:diadenylate cyclase n=1 Tax=Dyadobacter sp. CY345 TaxID=2909335 RepID=UPI001F2DCFA3|nr:diadenylate cyclase [Dyadobacter sp. CY345]MCF2447602.1 DNA integrity scanning protein DisA nucleotide-binding domain protein [Dyadobacter sp. CY345]
MSNLHWNRQKSCQKSIESAAGKFFSLLDPGLLPQVSLLGVDPEKPVNETSLFLEQADSILEINDFIQIHVLARQLGISTGTSRIKSSRKKVTGSQIDRARFRGYKLAVQKLLIALPAFEDKQLHVSAPCEIGPYLVFIILTLPREVIARYFTLQRSENDGQTSPSHSVIESAISVFLSECRGHLQESQFRKRFIDRSAEELLKSAGRDFMTTIEDSIEFRPDQISLFDAIDNVSMLRYEGRDAIGKILLAKEGHTNIVFTLRLSKPIPLNDSRKVRKLLELGDQNSCVVCDGQHLLGLGRARGNYNPKQNSLYCINFKGHYKWELLHDESPLLSVCHGLPKIRMEGIDHSYFTAQVNQVFKGLNASEIERLWEITLSATKQKAGTMIVISDHAKSESKRLANQCFKVEPLVLTQELVNQITAIDGAVLLDQDCVCHAIGVILDGIVSDKQGDASRGARYNSAIRYFSTNRPKHSILIIIISEDGMINLIPNE